MIFHIQSHIFVCLCLQSLNVTNFSKRTQSSVNGHLISVNGHNKYLGSRNWNQEHIKWKGVRFWCWLWGKILGDQKTRLRQSEMWNRSSGGGMLNYFGPLMLTKLLSRETWGWQYQFIRRRKTDHPPYKNMKVFKNKL